MSQGVKTAIAGVTGYAGAELARLLLNHPRLQNTPPVFLGRMGADETTLLWDLHPQLARNDGSKSPEVVPFSWEQLKAGGIEILFMATPHEQSREWAPQAIANGLRVVDLSGAWRLYERANSAVYKLEDADPAAAAKLQAEAVFGAPELHRAEIKSARIVANPGCYSTSVILPLAPLVQKNLVDLDRGIIADCKSGVSGAGKAPTAKTHFMHAADNLSAYSVFGHRHTGELYEQLHLTADQIRFTPHLLPIPRGILSSIYLRLKKATTKDALDSLFRSFYAESPMVRVHAPGNLPQIQNIVRTNFCDIGFELGPNGRDVLIISCLDNLLKGAAGQAVQNMNVMCGYGESEGLL
ncbi:MAG: N-acetyl-gamma-glutamyl-phosphate reductase [Acidobacteria bacterium]|nr:N-acetyl-gamma-glutamyl-phosphate reductase [Acidobacteriota bacterium]